MYIYISEIWPIIIFTLLIFFELFHMFGYMLLHILSTLSTVEIHIF